MTDISPQEELPSGARHRRTRREAMVLLGSAALTMAAASPAISQPLVTVRVGAAFTEGLTPVLYGIKAGIFTKHGLNIDLQAGPSGGVLAQAVTVGAIDIANASLEIPTAFRAQDAILGARA